MIKYHQEARHEHQFREMSLASHYLEEQPFLPSQLFNANFPVCIVSLTPLLRLIYGCAFLGNWQILPFPTREHETRARTPRSPSLRGILN